PGLSRPRPQADAQGCPCFPERVQGRVGQAAPSGARHHHRRVATLPQGAQEVVAERAASGLPLPCPDGDYQGRLAGTGETPQGDEDADPQAETRPAKEDGQGPEAAKQAAEAARGGIVRAPPFVRQAPPQRGGEESAEETAARPAAAASAAR